MEKARVNRTLFITRLHPNRVEEEIRNIFEPFGPLEEINVPKNFVTGRKKGGGFVKFCYRDDAINAFNVREFQSPNVEILFFSGLVNF